LSKFRISRIIARQVLDSRGNPTIEAELHAGRFSARAIVPSGASVGTYEAVELRDNDKRFQGKGVSKAIENIGLIAKKLKGKDVCRQRDIDNAMIELDGTINKSRLGANAILSVSLAAARTASVAQKKPLYAYISQLFKSKKLRLPVPFCNVINGGRHAGNELAMQEFMIAPVRARSFGEAVQSVSETYHVLKSNIVKKYGKNAANVGDEGGFAPPISKAEDALRLIQKAVDDAGHTKVIRLAMDPAASEFYNRSGIYLLHRQYTGEQLMEYYERLIERFGIASLEDPFEQNDFEMFHRFMRKAKIQVVGDDLLVTNVERIKIALQKKLCNALLMKVNQVGTLSEAMASARLALDNRWNTMVSHRSGDTEDPFIADLAVGIGCGQIKLGAPCRGERTAKYNQLLRIEEELGKKARYARW